MHDEENSVIIVPAGYLVCVSGNHSDDSGAQGFRWSYLDGTLDAVTECIKRLEAIQEAMPELQEGDYETWRDCLNKYVLPSVTPKSLPVAVQ